MKYDDLILTIGGFGRYQKFFFFLTFMTSVPNGLITLMFVFIHYLPDHHCNIPLLENLTSVGIEKELLLNLTLPWEKDVAGKVERSHCKRYNVTGLDILDFVEGKTELNYTEFTANREPIKCDHGWKYYKPEGFESAVTEFNMICDDSWKAPLAVSLYMAGMGIGALSGALADRFGRRPVFLWSTFLQFAFTGASGFAWNFTSYAAAMFITGLLGLVNFMVAFVMAAEIMDVKHRNSMAIGPFLAFSVGYFISPLFGFLLPNWRWYMYANGLYGIFYIPYFWVMPESPRWLITRGRLDEAKELLRKIARINRNKVDVDQIFDANLIIEDESKAEMQRSREANFFYVLCSKSLAARLVTIYFGWYVTSTVYYALSLNTSNLSGNRFINCLISALVEGPGYAFSWYMIKVIGRPRCMFLFMGVAGISCSVVPLMQHFAPQAAVITVAMIGKASISAVFYIVYFNVSELSPTLVRNFSSGVASACARIGGFTSPYLLYAGEKIHPSIPYLVMGGLGIVSSILGILFLPETKGVPLPESKKEAKENRRFYGIKLWKPAVNPIENESAEAPAIDSKI